MTHDKTAWGDCGFVKASDSGASGNDGMISRRNREKLEDFHGTRMKLATLVRSTSRGTCRLAERGLGWFGLNGAMSQRTRVAHQMFRRFALSLSA